MSSEVEEPIVVVATFYPRDESRAALRDVLTKLAPDVHAEPGCEIYALHDAEDGTIVMVEKWASRGHLDAHSNGHVVPRMREMSAPFIVSPTEVISMTALPAGDPIRGQL